MHASPIQVQAAEQDFFDHGKEYRGLDTNQEALAIFPNDSIFYVGKNWIRADEPMNSILPVVKRRLWRNGDGNR